MQKKILIADDDRNLIKMLKSMLTQFGYEIKTANEGATTLRLIKEFKPDLILLDIMMPIIDGYHICKTLSENPAYSPIPKIIILTVRKDDWDKRISEFAGADGFMSKPFQTDILLAKIEELIGTNG